MNEYQQQATDFLTTAGMTFKPVWLKHGLHFVDDKQTRDIWILKLVRKSDKTMLSTKFGQSIAAGGKAPTAYDLLTCITKYDPGTFENFCGDYGYDSDSRKAEKIYQGVVKEWEKVSKFFTEEELTALGDIN